LTHWQASSRNGATLPEATMSANGYVSANSSLLQSG
jgi:hypothetical protein